MSLDKYPASRSVLMSSFLTEEAVHLLLAPDPDMIGVRFRAEMVRAWALELKNEWAEEESVGE